MHRIVFLPDIRLFKKPYTGYLAGYPVRAGYRISGRISDRILGLITIFFGKISNKFMKTALPITDFV
jgi:hypothetical protein